MADETKLGLVIDRFYEAALDPEKWKDVLHTLAQAVGAAGAMIIAEPNVPLRPVHSEVLDEVVEEGLRQKWFEKNPRIPLGSAALSRSPVITDEVIFGPGELDRLPFHAEFASKFGFRSFAAATLTRVGSSSVFLSVEKLQKQGTFSNREIELITKALPHLRTAARITLHVAEAHVSGVMDTFEALGSGSILLNSAGDVIRVSSRAEKHFRGALRLTNRRVHAQHREADAQLQKLIGRLLQHDPDREGSASEVIAIPRLGRHPLIIKGAPIPSNANEIFRPGRALLIVSDLEREREEADSLLKTIFGLTPAEARLCAGLANGSELKELAEMFGIAEDTARKQLKSAFAKMGVHRQAELVAIIHKLPT